MKLLYFLYHFLCLISNLIIICLENVNFKFAHLCIDIQAWYFEIYHRVCIFKPFRCDVFHIKLKDTSKHIEWLDLYCTNCTAPLRRMTYLLRT